MTQLTYIGYLIKPLDATVQRVTLRDYEDIYKWCGYNCFSHVQITRDGDGVFVDDEGLLKPNPPNNFFIMQDYPEPLCGNGMVLGCDREGNSISPTTGWEVFKSMVKPCLVARINGEIGYIPGDFTFLDDILPARED